MPKENINKTMLEEVKNEQFLTALEEVKNEQFLTANECKNQLLKLSAQEAKNFNVMVFNDISLYNLVMGGIIPVVEPQTETNL